MVDEPIPNRTWEITDKHGVARRYATADFDEFLTTSDEYVVHQHLAIGWLLLDERVLPGAGPGHEELVERLVSTGGYGGASLRKVPVHMPDDLQQFVLGHLKPGVSSLVVGH